MSKELKIIVIYPQGDRIVTEYSDGTKTDVHKNDYDFCETNPPTVEDLKSQVFEIEVTQETLDLNPELIGEVEVGEIIQVAAENEPNPPTVEDLYMTYEEAEKLLLSGELIKLDEWGGFWFSNIKSGKVFVMTKDNEILDTPHDKYKQEDRWVIAEPTEEQSRLLDEFQAKLAEEPKPEEGKKSKQTNSKKQK